MFSLQKLKIWSALNKYSGTSLGDVHMVNADATIYKETSGTKMVRLDSDGFMVQTGRGSTSSKKATITMSKEYTNKDSYVVIVQPITETATTGKNFYGVNVYRDTGKSFTVTASTSSISFNWIAIGTTSKTIMNAIT